MATLHLYLDQNGKEKITKGTETRGSGKDRYEVEVHRLHGTTVMDAETPNPYVFSVSDDPRFPPEILACVTRCTLVTGFTHLLYYRTSGIYELDGAIGTIERGGEGGHHSFSGKIESADPDKLFKLYEAIRDGSLAPWSLARVVKASYICIRRSRLSA